MMSVFLSNAARNIQSELTNACEKIFGDANVSSDRTTLLQYGSSCGAGEHIPLLVVKPGTRDELKQLLSLAHEYEIPLYPISKGKNWGYGSAAPNGPGMIVVDLSRLNAIVELNGELGYAVIEPGVTQEQLYREIQDRQYPLIIDVSSSSTDASLLGNLLERGFGHTPYADHFLHSCALEIMLADGSILKTGFGHFADSRIQHVHRWGVGPFLDGIFSQSNFGIVVQATIWLMPQPEDHGVMLMNLQNDEELLASIDRLRTLALKGVLSGAVHVINDLRMISSLQQYPFERTEGKTPLPENVLTELKKKWGVGCWNILSGFWGSKDHVKADMRMVRQAFPRQRNLTLIRERQMERASRFPRIAKVLGISEIAKKKSIFNLLKGIPTNTALRGPYWRKRTVLNPVSFDPARDRCGILWYAPIVPLTKNDLALFLRTSRSVYAHFGLEFNVSLNLTSARSCSCTLGILFDAEREEEQRAATECYAVLAKELSKHGFFPYRLGTNASAIASTIFQADDVFVKTCRALKAALDPANVIAPGKYGIE